MMLYKLLFNFFNLQSLMSTAVVILRRFARFLFLLLVLVLIIIDVIMFFWQCSCELGDI